MAKDYEKAYLEFASNIHFFEFIQKEFKEPHFNVEKYPKEIMRLSSKDTWTVKELTEFLRDNPSSYDVFKEIFQLARFTNTQLTHFLFDVKALNSSHKDNLIFYLKENLFYDSLFFKIFINLFKKSKFEQLKFKKEFNNKDNLVCIIASNKNEEIIDFLIMLFKTSIARYVRSAVKNVEVVHNRIINKNFIDVSERMASYIVDNLNLNDTLKGIKLKELLETKRIPIDTKAIHGNFGKIKISSILKKHGFTNVDELLDRNNIKTLSQDLRGMQGLKELKGKFVFATERYVEGIRKRKDGKHKLFDFILIYDLKPKILIETNFYSTAGTKIGINQGEYIDLSEDIKEQFKHFAFLWVTDGDYWLSSGGRSRLIALFRYFDENILNYNLFDKRLENIKQFLKE